ncbi:MAG: hypothetical protein HQK53_02455 [Oligoflexia bacterium]|nr:hypothetical protein [Oligoflexia bacterium]
MNFFNHENPFCKGPQGRTPAIGPVPVDMISTAAVNAGLLPPGAEFINFLGRSLEECRYTFEQETLIKKDLDLIDSILRDSDENLVRVDDRGELVPAKISPVPLQVSLQLANVKKRLSKMLGWTPGSSLASEMGGDQQPNVNEEEILKVANKLSAIYGQIRVYQKLLHKLTTIFAEKSYINQELKAAGIEELVGSLMLGYNNMLEKIKVRDTALYRKVVKLNQVY